MHFFVTIVVISSFWLCLMFFVFFFSVKRVIKRTFALLKFFKQKRKNIGSSFQTKEQKYFHVYGVIFPQTFSNS